MNKMMKHLAAFVVLMLAIVPAFAQGPGFATGVNDGCEIPLDGGLTVLAAAGIGYGLKKYRDARNKQVSEA